MMDNIVVTTGLVILFIAIQYICLKDFQFSFWGTFSASILFVVLYIVLIILHETSHLIGFMLFGGVPFKSLKYGVNLELGVAYATTDQPLPNHAMKKKHCCYHFGQLVSYRQLPDFISTVLCCY